MKKNSLFINWLFVGISLILFVIITLIILFVPAIKEVDTALLKSIQAIIVAFPVAFAQQACTVGSSHHLLWPQLTAISALFSHKKYFNGILLVIFTQIAWRCFDSFKDIIARPRPCGDLYPGYSFPSGHATTTMCFYGILVYLVLHYVKNKFWRYALTSIFSIFIFIVSISRLKLNVHYPLDVFAGLCAGFALLNLFIIISKTLEKHHFE